MTLIVFGIVGLFCLAVFGGTVVELAATMNGWGFLSLLALLLFWNRGRFRSYRMARGAMQRNK
jgi:hypothetical protein